MRKSVRKGDPGYDPEAYMYNVYLDGVQLYNCHTADENLGICYCWAADNTRLNGSNDLDTFECRGEVRIERIGHARIN